MGRTEAGFSGMFDMKMFRHLALGAALLACAATASAQDTSGSGTYGTLQLNAGFSGDPRTVQLSAGGSVDAAQTIGGRCLGMIANNPDYTLDYSAGDFPLYVSADADVDTTLVVYAPDGFYYCDDDSAGELDPGVYLPKPPAGRYQIWVGTFSSSAGTPPATVYISELNYVHDLGSTGPAQPTHLAAFGANPTYGSTALTSGFSPDPFTANVRAGGGNSLNEDLNQCYGYVASNPDYRLDWTAGSGSLPLIFSVASDTDTTLAIRDPSGNFTCDDDSGDAPLNPMIRYEGPASGSYEVWVGTYAADAGAPPAVLHISELYTQ